MSQLFNHLIEHALESNYWIQPPSSKESSAGLEYAAAAPAETQTLDINYMLWLPKVATFIDCLSIEDVETSSAAELLNNLRWANNASNWVDKLFFIVIWAGRDLIWSSSFEFRHWITDDSAIKYV